MKANDENIYDEESLGKIKKNVEEKVKRHTLSFFFTEHPYAAKEKELVLTLWEREKDDVLDYSVFFKKYNGPWKDFEKFENFEDICLVKNETESSSVHGCMK